MQQSPLFRKALGAALLSTLLFHSVGCQRDPDPETIAQVEHREGDASDQSDENKNGVSEGDVSENGESKIIAEPIPVVSVVSKAEDLQRQWLPPLESRLSENTVQLKDIPALVSAGRAAAQEALQGDDLAALATAEQQLQEVQAAIYGLAVRMRGVWTQMEYQSFLSELRYHEILDLSANLKQRQSDLRHQRWLWAGAD